MAHNTMRAIRKVLSVALGMTFLCLVSVESSPAQQQDGFTLADAATLLQRMNDALMNRQTGKFLSVFDLTKMSGGALFKQQVTSFISHSDSIRMHFNLTEVTMTGAQGEATADAEMEAEIPNSSRPALYKQATLRFSAEKTGASWKFIDVQPRSFFSSSRSPAASPNRSSSGVE
ncbi:MAG TPA: hypothetical protein VFY05_09425 [Candidatus Angelobacter sp.]|nr:hypothetical protein [Candidatus Angelobacter sp.]